MLPEEDLRDVLYHVGSTFDLQSHEGIPAGSPEFKRGLVHLMDLVQHSLDARRMSLQHLNVVGVQALKQVKGQWGAKSQEYMGALLGLLVLFTYVKGADHALRNGLVQPTGKRPF